MIRALAMASAHEAGYFQRIIYGASGLDARKERGFAAAQAVDLRKLARSFHRPA